MNRTTAIMKKQTTSILLLAVILMQSCVAYNRTSVPISEAYNKGRVHITTTQGDNVNFRNIELKDNIYYGVNNKQLTRLDDGQILAIHLQDLKKSKNQTFALISSVVLVGALVALFFVAVIAAANAI